MPSPGGVDRWSTGDLWTTHAGATTRAYLEVRREGVLVLTYSTGHEDGKLQIEGAAAFTKEHIYKGLEGS